MQNNSNPLVLRDFSIEELLCREPVEIDTLEISEFISGKRVMVTGAAGSIGSELVRQIAKFNPESLIFFDHNENNQFFLEKEIRENHPNLKIIPRIGSVADLARAKAIFDETQPQIIYHAAANKHVPLSESNPSEAIQNNILGTQTVAFMSTYVDAEAFILVSTDKAVNPTSVMGATKRVAEYYMQICSQRYPNTRFITVRFGNVLGSSGSVVPIFKAQIESGGPVKVTHPDMTRFFMTIPEAASLLLQASVFADTGSIYVLDMGESVKILDLAKNMIKLSGFVPDVDIKIEFSGIRPGEKIFEELSFSHETTTITQHPKIRNTKTPLPPEFMRFRIMKLISLDSSLDPVIVRKELFDLISEEI